MPVPIATLLARAAQVAIKHRSKVIAAINGLKDRGLSSATMEEFKDVLVAKGFWDSIKTAFSDICEILF